MSVPIRYLEPSSRSRPRRRRSSRGPRRVRRVPPAGAVAIVVLLALGAGGVVWLLAHRANERRKDAVAAFGAAWERGDYQAMYDRLDTGSRARVSRVSFVRAYRRAATASTLRRIAVAEPKRDGDGWELAVRATTRSFGVLRGPVRMHVGGDPARIAWSLEMTFPGVRRGERLHRSLRAPRRAPLLARNGRTLADRDGVQTALGAQTGITGELGRAEGATRRALVAAGFPADTAVGVSGLQKALDPQLRGIPGGTLFAGRRVLARTRPRGATAVRSSIDPRLSAAAQSALAGRFGSVAVVQPQTGEVLALAGIALDGAQPPGSTFKIMTVTAGLETGVTKMTSRYPVLTGANAGGRYIANAHDEACGGDLTESFSKSCNSVFAPMGAKLGARRLIDVAQRFGFNHPTGVPGASAASIPRRMDSVEAGASAIGQGRVLATALNMAVVGATIANGGRRPLLTLLHGGRPRSVRATSPRIAALVTTLMESVVNGAGATGGAARIDGVEVAGKTGTAELGGDQENDAWFVAFAPAQRAQLALAVLVVNGGFGGDTAAPIAKQVLQAGL
jgi:penicillin-binding protein A